MKKLIRLLKFIATGSFTLMLTACYGVVYNVMYGVPIRILNGTVQINNADDLPIPGLKVSLLENGYTSSFDYTDPAGEADFQVDSMSLSDFQLQLEDVDGLDNRGLFQTQIIPVEFGDDDEVISISVEMNESVD